MMADLADALVPGAFILELFAGFIGMQSDIPRGLYFAGSCFFSLLFWAAAWSFTLSLLRRILGWNETPRGQR